MKYLLSFFLLLTPLAALQAEECPVYYGETLSFELPATERGQWKLEEDVKVCGAYLQGWVKEGSDPMFQGYAEVLSVYGFPLDQNEPQNLHSFLRSMFDDLDDLEQATLESSPNDILIRVGEPRGNFAAVIRCIVTSSSVHCISYAIQEEGETEAVIDPLWIEMLKSARVLSID